LKNINSNKKFYTALLFVLISGWFFLASASSVSAAGYWKSQKSYPSSYFDPLISFAEKTIKGFGFSISLAAEPDPDFCGQDIIFGCSAGSPYGGMSWEPAPASVSGEPFRYYQYTLKHIFHADETFNVYGGTFTWLWSLDNGYYYGWSVEAIYGGGISSAAFGVTNQPHGGFLTPDCAIYPCTSAPNACGQTNSGGMVGGVCDATTPPNPPGYGSSCTSAPNACGQTNTGTIRCDGSCSASTPPVSSCPGPTVSISASPSSILYNTASTISWSSTNATSCTVSPSGWTGISGSRSTGNLISSQTYTANCSGYGGSASNSATVSVGSAPSLTFTADSTSIAYNASTILRWSSANTTTCTASGLL